MRVTFSARVKADLQAIGDYIAADNPARAVTFVAELQARCLALADAPQVHAIRPYLGRGVRGCPFGNYLIFYRALRNEVQVIRVIHAARDIRDLARHGLDLNEPRPAYEVSDFEALGFVRVRAERDPASRPLPAAVVNFAPQKQG